MTIAFALIILYLLIGFGLWLFLAWIGHVEMWPEALGWPVWIVFVVISFSRPMPDPGAYAAQTDDGSTIVVTVKLNGDINLRISCGKHDLDVDVEKYGRNPNLYRALAHLAEVLGA